MQRDELMLEQKKFWSLVHAGSSTCARARTCPGWPAPREKRCDASNLFLSKKWSGVQIMSEKHACSSTHMRMSHGIEHCLARQPSVSLKG